MLGQKQREFSYHVTQLIQHIYAMGYAVTLGDAYRDPRSHGKMGEEGPYGRRASAHKNRLAIDLNLFIDNMYIQQEGPYTQFGTWWKALHRENEWGGDWKSDDANHFSRRHSGVA